MKCSSIGHFYYLTGLSWEADELRRLIYSMCCYCEQGYLEMSLATYPPPYSSKSQQHSNEDDYCNLTYLHMTLYFRGWFLPGLTSCLGVIAMCRWVCGCFLLEVFCLCKKNAEMWSSEGECSMERTASVHEHNVHLITTRWLLLPPQTSTEGIEYTRLSLNKDGWFFTWRGIEEVQVIICIRKSARMFNKNLQSVRTLWSSNSTPR